MLVYGDCRRQDSPQRLIAELRTELESCPPSGPAQGEWATTLLIRAGELIQGLLDAFELRMDDAVRAYDDQCRELALATARLYLAIEFDEADDHRKKPTYAETRTDSGQKAARAALRALSRLARRDLPREVTIHAPEGYAYYAVYPVLYALAARELRGRQCSWVVVGIRSIGTSLGAVVAAVVGAEYLLFVRPTGPPFRRTLPFDPTLEAMLGADQNRAHYAIVDEGPGLSGSSFGAVADWLQQHGVASSRLHFFPSHAGDLGPQASESHRARWQRAHRCHHDFDAFFDETRLRSAVFDGGKGDIRDISRGLWRAELGIDLADWPPVHPGLERRKYLLRSSSSAQVAKFVGLGAHGRALVARARLLHRGGFIPEPLDYRNGFLISTWYPAVTFPHASPTMRGEWLARAAEYLAFRARACRVANRGASAAELLKMASVNVGLAFGRDAALVVESRWSGRLPHLASSGTPLAIDGRLHRWEWLALSDGRLLKADAIEHHADHGLVGCQDLAWDLAGLRVELATTSSEYERVLAVLRENSFYRSDAEREQFYLLCYLAYQMGYYTLAADAAEGRDTSERQRATLRCGYYTNQLQQLLGLERIS